MSMDVNSPDAVRFAYGFACRIQDAVCACTDIHSSRYQCKFLPQVNCQLDVVTDRPTYVS